jgi:hypothetical protein
MQDRYLSRFKIDDGGIQWNEMERWGMGHEAMAEDEAEVTEVARGERREEDCATIHTNTINLLRFDAGQYLWGVGYLVSYVSASLLYHLLFNHSLTSLAHYQLPPSLRLYPSRPSLAMFGLVTKKKVGSQPALDVHNAQVEYRRNVYHALALSPLASNEIAPNANITDSNGRVRFVVSEYIYSPLVVPTPANLKDFGFTENPSGMWSYAAGKDGRQYEEVEDLPALLRTRFIGLPENAALLGLAAVYDDGVNDKGRKEIGIVQ